MRDPAAIHTTGLGFTLQDAVADHATLADFPTPGVVGRLAKALDSGIVYRDNASAWQVWVSPGTGSSGFPITFDDGTHTYTIDIEGTDLVIKNVLDAGTVVKAKLQLDADGFAQFTTLNGFEVNDLTGGGGIFLFEHDGGGIFLRDYDGGGVFLRADNAGGVFIDDYGGGGTFFTDHAGGGLFLNGLPTSAPGGSKQVWNNGGVLNITP